MRTRILPTLALAALASACGARYVQPPPPTAVVDPTILPLRAVTIYLERGDASVDASGLTRFGTEIVGTFREDGTFTLPDGLVWARLEPDGRLIVQADHPASEGPTEERFTLSDDRLIRPDGQTLASLDPTGQIVTALGTHSVGGITSRTRRLALFLYLVAASYAEDLPEPP